MVFQIVKGLVADHVAARISREIIRGNRASFGIFVLLDDINAECINNYTTIMQDVVQVIRRVMTA